MGRAILVGWSCLVFVSLSWAVPRPSGVAPIKERKLQQSDARRFAVQIHSLIEQISDQYVRPVSRETLLEAALVGLYQAARRPVPRELRERVRAAVAEATLLRTSADTRPAARVPFDAREKLLAVSREQLADAEALTGQDPVLICCHALARVLDPYSGIVHAEEQRRAVGLDQESFGIGIELKGGLAAGQLIVEQVHLGSPAQRAGLRPGDIITRISTVSADKVTPEALLLLRSHRIVVHPPRLNPGKDGRGPQFLAEEVRLGYRRGDAAEQRTTIRLERFRPESVLGVRRKDDNSWNYLVDERAGLAHVRLSALSRGTAEELRTVLQSLRHRKVRGLVLDLRWCPGGYLNEAVEAADLLLGNGVIATVKMRAREDTVYRSTDSETFGELAVVVLVNGETSGGAELIAAALQDHHRAVLVGQRTLGKASVQTPLGVGIEGVGFKLTNGTFFRPSGKNLHRFSESTGEDTWGVIPNEDCRVSRDFSKRLRDWWLTYSLRPARSRERLPLDDPRADPQQQHALGVLRRLLDRKVRARSADD